jgi:hypothetical protein
VTDVLLNERGEAGCGNLGRQVGIWLGEFVNQSLGYALGVKEVKLRGSPHHQR